MTSLAIIAPAASTRYDTSIAGRVGLARVRLAP